MANQQEVCQKQFVNYKDFLEKLEKGKKFVNSERTWNIFKDYDKSGLGYLNYDQLVAAFKGSFPKVNNY